MNENRESPMIERMRQREIEDVLVWWGLKCGNPRRRDLFLGVCGAQKNYKPSRTHADIIRMKDYHNLPPCRPNAACSPDHHIGNSRYRAGLKMRVSLRQGSYRELTHCMKTCLNFDRSVNEYI